MNFLRTLLALLLFGAAGASAGVPDSGALIDTLVALAPEISTEALQQAVAARDCALASGAALAASRLAVIDYSRPSTEPRLWVFEMGTEPKLLFAEHVAHGRGSGENLARSFSNREGSHQTSLGLFRTAETYQGGNGYSLRLDGLEPGMNDAARARAIVMHGAPYVDPDLAKRQGRLGRSYGCPAVREAVARPLIDSLRDGQLLFAYHSDAQWKSSSTFINCPALASTLTAGTAAPASVSTSASASASSTGTAPR